MKVTVFTPTYNRANTLPRLYEALRRQTDKRFEWLIIDDGSTDKTAEEVRDFLRENEFKVRYYRKAHEGKPRAQNYAVDLAIGEMFITCDSNKYLADNAIELIIKSAETIANIPMMCGVGGYRADFEGRVYGGKMNIENGSYVDCTRLENEKYHIQGDKASAFFTEILRQYKSPEFIGELLISEASWLIPMSMDGYKTRWIPEILVYGEYAKDGLTRLGANSREGHFQNFRGFLYTLKVEISARGIEPMLYLIHEGIDIAEEKKMTMREFSEHIGCTMWQIRKIRILRRFHALYGRLPLRMKRLIRFAKRIFT